MKFDSVFPPLFGVTGLRGLLNNWKMCRFTDVAAAPLLFMRHVTFNVL